MLRTKPISSNVAAMPKPSKLDNVPINVVVVITIRSQQSEQKMLKERKLIKIKRAKDWQQEEHLWDSFTETIRQLQHGENDEQNSTTNKEPLESN
jgi:hypothetical protein